MFNCIKCNKEFKYESDYNKHKNRKTPCGDKKKLNCQYCNVNFTCSSNQQKHEKTIKHINNYNKYIQNNVNGDNIAGDQINNIINLTLNVKPFLESELKGLNNLLNDIVNNIYLEEIENKNGIKNMNIQKLINGLILILEKVNFNVSFEENHNCKILLMFPGINKSVYEYLVLEVDPISKKMIWNRLEYKNFLIEIFKLCRKIAKKYTNENYLEYLNILQDQILDKNVLIHKEYIESELNKLYINFNKKQEKNERDIKIEFNDKLDEYKEYRNNELRLNNGYIPNIKNSLIS
jgi:hypothetical protein